jgi:hypothetical protein
MRHGGTIYAMTARKDEPRLTLQETRVPEAEDNSRMFCQGCGYNLFGLTSPQCPECGRPFDPNDASTFYGNAHPPKRWPVKLGIILALYPILAVLSLYIAWIAGRIELGHWPRPMIDDPKYIGGSVDVFYMIAAILVYLLLFPVLLVNGAFILVGIEYKGIRWVFKKEPPSLWSWLLLIMTGITWTGCFLVLRWDPLRVFEWFMD